nr:MAG: ORF1 [TTV-like mini virus]UGV33928.1 MAG: ORF1 [TTV-like mini virus]UGV34198.1 MAG: ORF1 [TTV-like mini virus]UGV34252.1 MAG: ORF1 [TTV-like mini virus]UGV37418.1 MAG: ORF1 [TTV-like mini virus]
MPYYWKNRYRQRFYRRRRKWFPSWRTRSSLRRRRYRKRRRFRKYKVKKRRFLKKKVKLVIQQFQPKSIRKCKIVGSKCLFQGSSLRCHHNYAQYANSKTPELHPGGGGWTLYVFSLDSLYEDYQKLQNVWTHSNCNLPLVRYTGCTMKFYQSDVTDYMVVYDTCWPMVDTYLTHADASPTSMLLKRRKITVPSRLTQKNKKPYKKVRIKPPTQLQSKWYFQKELCTTPLVMLTATAISLTKPFCNDKCSSNNVSIKCLSPYIFKNFNFQTLSNSYGYYCKYSTYEHEDAQHKMYLWATHSNNNITEVNNTNIKNLQLIPLVNTLDYKPGKPITDQNWENKRENWGNPFYYENLDRDSITIYISFMNTFEASQLIKTPTLSKSYAFTKVVEPLIFTVRYNPETDKGLKNKAWLLSTSKEGPYDPPADTNLILEGFPLYVLFWGWTDWIKKAKLIQDPDQNSILIFETDQFDIKLPRYIPVDKDFLEGYDPYIKHENDGHPRTPSLFSQTHWYPKLQFQDQTIEHICMSGPACPRVPNDYYLQAFFKYKFYFKWGGCPKQLEKACNPCSQPTWTTPDNFSGRLEISNPNTSPETNLFEWDWDSDYVTEEAINRIQKHTETDTSPFIFTGSKNQPKATKKSKETHQKETQNIINQFQQLQQQRQELQLLLLNQLNTK